MLSSPLQPINNSDSMHFSVLGRVIAFSFGQYQNDFASIVSILFDITTFSSSVHSANASSSIFVTLFGIVTDFKLPA